MSSSLSLLEHVPELTSLLGLNNTLLLYPLGAYIKHNIIYRRKEFRPLPCVCSLMYLCDTSSPFGYLLRHEIAGFSNSLIILKILICIVYVYDVESVYTSTFPRSGSRLCVKCIYFLSFQWPWILRTHHWMLWHYDFIWYFKCFGVLLACISVHICAMPAIGQKRVLEPLRGDGCRPPCGNKTWTQILCKNRKYSLTAESSFQPYDFSF